MDSKTQSFIIKGLLGVSALGLIGATLYYLSLDDEYEEQKKEVNEIGTAVGGFSKMDMESYLDYN